MTDTYHVIGIMSGTSLDGVDIAFCRFNLKHHEWNYEIIEAKTLPYSPLWRTKLADARNLFAPEFAQLHVDYGHYLGKAVNDFIETNNYKPDFIASHGHTIFHNPSSRLTVQIGSGAAIAAETRQIVICDFRTTDMAFGGQGAPLVPVGDELLFSDYDLYLNIGGFANLSYKSNNKRIAFDICPANIILNMLAQKAGLEYDADGKVAEHGNIDETLLSTLNQKEYYTQPPPKSLGVEWLYNNLIPHIADSTLSLPDLLRTFTEHIAIQISGAIIIYCIGKTLATGGGVHNKFLVKRINSMLNNDLIIPDPQIIDYKEALIFAFLGVLRFRNENNCLKSVTGAGFDNCGGAIYNGLI